MTRCGKTVHRKGYKPPKTKSATADPRKLPDPLVNTRRPTRKFTRLADQPNKRSADPKRVVTGIEIST